jgi:hypothetical protein
MLIDHIDKTRVKEFERFLICVNERTEWQYNLRDEYIPPENDPALGPTVDFFGFNIAQDDRMRYIMENIVSLSSLSESNKICNTIISHFYGARGIHTVVTGEKDPKKAHVDFDKVASGDKAYLDGIYHQIKLSQDRKAKFYGTTELHTSLQTAARNFCRVKHNDPTRKANATDMIEWVADFITNGTVDKVLRSKSLQETYGVLTNLPGVGEYYGYHCSTSNSVNPILPFQHDEKFCVPGPGAKQTCEYLFESLKTGKKLPYGDIVIAVRDHQESLFNWNKLVIHPFFHNFTLSDGTKIFADSQDRLKTYGTEVAFCQFAVYLHLKKNPHLINKRKVARADDDAPKQSSLLSF